MMQVIQESMFDILDEGFCFDSDINKIVEMLDGIFEKYGMVTQIDKEWSVWDHVPNLGYRLSYDIYFNDPLPDEVFKELAKVSGYAKEKKIEAGPFGYSFYEHDKMGSMSIYSIYKDERIKIK